ncbi:MAG: hypothetical protein OXD44_11155 [Gammaproteobacteria bacterium]|nr:hypothetical protein [Gammaproteobacteria bacterium]
MPHNEHDKRTAIPVDLIKETIMPPYEFQKPQNGFGSASFEESQFHVGKEKKLKNKVDETGSKANRS